METLIVLCLLIITGLLVYDKLPLHRNQTAKKEDNILNLPNIIGKPKHTHYHSVPKTTNESQIQELEINPDNLDIEFDENEIIHHQNSNEELDDTFSYVPDFEEEEEEWRRNEIDSDNYGLAQGVTFEELSQMESFLETNGVETSKKETTVAIVQKLQGTELFNLLEDSIENASTTISKLLDSRVSSETDSNSSILRKQNFDDFDIGEFI